MICTRRPRTTAALVAAIAIGLLAGCSPEAPGPSEPPAASPETTAPSESASASPTPSAPEPDGVDPAEVAAARESLAASIASGNTAALASWVTDVVRVTIAASEFSEDVSPGEAANQAGYIVDLAATWNFALPEATIEQYRAGDYGAYFPADALVGLSSSGRVVAFTMTGARASAMFMCIDEQLLLF